MVNGYFTFFPGSGASGQNLVPYEAALLFSSASAADPFTLLSVRSKAYTARLVHATGTVFLSNKVNFKSPLFT